MSQIDHADFTPSAPNFKHLVFMNMQQLTNFPYIEKDFDALTDYGLLCKVVDYLNEVIANNNEQNSLMVALRDAYIELQNYVNDYFDNLDVQDEINNKLDEMARDGSLTALIKKYIDPIVELQNEEINNLSGEINNISTNINLQLVNMNNKINNLSSGSPIPVSNISDMTDTTKIYVLTTDGYWYYYDGDSWERGGVYQSEVIETDKTLTESDVPADAKVTGNYIYSLAEYNALELIDTSLFTDGKFVNPTNGQLSNNASYSASNFIPIEENTEYKLKGNKQIYGAYYSTDDETGYIDGIQYNTTLPTDTTITTPEGANYIRISGNTLELSHFSLKLKVDYPIKLKDDVYINKNNIIDYINYHTITIKPNGGGDYTTIKDAFNSINDSSPTNRYIVEFYGDGNEYDVLDEFTSISGSIGLRVPPFTNFVGIGGSRQNILVARLDSMSNAFSTLNLYQTSNLKGFTIIGYNTRYAVHDDFYDNSESGYERIVEDVIAISEKTYYFRAWGAGIRSGMKWTFKDCIFTGNQSLNEGSFSCHNNIGFTDPANITFINCRCNSKYESASINWGMRFSSIVNDANGIINNINVIGNKIQALLFSEENASVYGSGMLWYCTGYANDIKTGTIINSDGNNYDDRINLI